MTLLSEAFLEALDEGSRIFDKLDSQEVCDDSWISGRRIDFELLKDCIGDIRPRAKLFSREERLVERILITHQKHVARSLITLQIQLLSKLMDFYIEEIVSGLLEYPGIELFPESTIDHAVVEQIKRQLREYKSALQDKQKPVKLPTPTNDKEIIQFMRIISVLTRHTEEDPCAPVKRPAIRSSRPTPKPRSHSNRPRRRRESFHRQDRPSRSYERREPDPELNQPDSTRERRDSTSKNGLPNGSPEEQDFCPEHERRSHPNRLSHSLEEQDSTPEPKQSRSDRSSHSHERQDLNSECEGGRSVRPSERQDSAPKEDLYTPPLSIRIKSGDKVRVTFRS